MAIEEVDESGEVLLLPLLSEPFSDPQIIETTLLLEMWVPEQKEKETKDLPSGLPPGEGAVQSPSPEEQSQSSLCRSAGPPAAREWGQLQGFTLGDKQAGVLPAVEWMQQWTAVTGCDCFCTGENCWAKFSTASSKRPVWDTGELRNLTLSLSLMSPDTARDLEFQDHHRTTHSPGHSL